MKPVENQAEGREQKVRAYDHQNRISADGLRMEHRFCKSKNTGVSLGNNKSE